MNQAAALVPAQWKANEAAVWLSGHQSATLMYVSLTLFFVTRTISRLVDR